ncbi:MAG: hypothetical protein ABSG46_06885 [Candidatus Binataceae bacterium]
MKITVDEDVAKVTEFMTRSMPAHKLQGVAHAVARFADFLWADYSDKRLRFTAFQIDHPPIGAAPADQPAPQLNTSAQDQTLVEPMEPNVDGRYRS